MKIIWYNKKWVIILLHTLAWFAIFSLPFLVRTSNNDQHRPAPDTAFMEFYITTRIFWISFFYLNAFPLFSKLIIKKQYWLYVLAQVIALFILSFLNWIFFSLFVKQTPYEFNTFLMFNTFLYLFILAASTAYRMILDKIKIDQLLHQKENENLKTELSFLRSQVSPHFMFNVLNNMVSLARKHSDQLEPSLIKLSSLMRYMLYETDEEKVPLEKEIEYLQSYIDLQQQRFGKKLKLNVCLKIADNSLEVEPMLLIPFVENAFKHGTGMIEDAQIDIELKAEKNTLKLLVRNKYNGESNEIKDKTTGIGLTNVKRRLNLLYSDNHNLIITKKDSWFVVSLSLNLH
ncbi:MAG: sensor histidine kinase [Chitinophagaceae bacterium]